MSFITRTRSVTADAVAPDGSEVRLLATATRGSMAQFTLPPGAISKPVAHHSVEEVWLVMAGRGRMWRKRGDSEETVELSPGVSLVIPAGASFQFRNDGDVPLECVGTTMPPWPGMEEAYAVAGIW